MNNIYPWLDCRFTFIVDVECLAKMVVDFRPKGEKSINRHLAGRTVRFPQLPPGPGQSKLKTET